MVPLRVLFVVFEAERDPPSPSLRRGEVGSLVFYYGEASAESLGLESSRSGWIACRVLKGQFLSVTLNDEPISAGDIT